MTIFRQLFDSQSSTYTYLIADSDTRAAVLVDTVFEQAQRDAALVRELGLRVEWLLDTHVHADHVTGAWLLKRMVGGRIGISAAGGAKGADRYLVDGDRVAFGSRHLEVRATPGHTTGCLTYVLDDASMAFTGDCLLIRGSGRTDFQSGDAQAMFRSVRQRIFTLPDDCRLYPAHDYRGVTVTTVAEERRFNPRLGGEVGERDFVGYMNNLGLPHPKKMDVAVPANLECGRPHDERAPAAGEHWAPIAYTFGGVWEIQPHSLNEIASTVQVVDVREPDEFNGPMGHIAGARLIPLGQLRQGVAELDRERPVVTVCRSGARSAHAASILGKEGFAKVANLAGGMLRWRAEGYEVEGGRE